MPAVVALTVAIRLAHLLEVYDEPLFGLHRTFTQSDMAIFDEWARRIAAGDVLGREVYHPIVGWQLGIAPEEKWNAWFGHAPVFYKAPLYPYLVALLYALFGTAMLPLALLQIAASGLSAFLLVRIGEPLFGRTAALLGAASYALFAPDVHYAVLMLRGPWIVLLGLLVTHALVRLRAEPSARTGLRAGVCIGGALLLNETFATLLPLAAVAVIAWVPRLRPLAAVGGGLVLGFLSTLAPLVMRNLVTGAPPFALAVTGSMVYAFANAAGANPIRFQVIPSVLRAMLPHAEDGLLPMAWACLRSFEGVFDFLAFYLTKAAGLLMPFEAPDNANFHYAALTYPLLGLLPTYAAALPLILLGIGLSAPRLANAAPLLPVAGSLLLGIMLSLPLSRYRATLAACLMPFAGVALAQLLTWLRARRLAPLAVAAGTLAVIVVAARSVQERVVFASGPAGGYYRPNEFMHAARVLAEQGRFADAAAEVMRLAEHTPDPAIRQAALRRAGELEAQHRSVRREPP